MHARGTLISIGIALAFASGTVTPAPVHAGKTAPRYYVSLGTSLSVGVQPDRDGQNRERTHEGYADQLYAALSQTIPGLRLHKLGCKGETTTSMIAGGICTYDEGSQLAEAVSFLGAHGGSVALVTIDMGANDIEPCGSLTGFDQACVAQAFLNVATNLPYILATLQAAVGPDVTIVAMNYYNPFVAAWLLGPEGQLLALQSAGGLAAFNGLLGLLYGQAGVPVADVAAAFHADDFITFVPVPGFGDVPLNVALVCQWTWMCVPPPQGPNIHANATGYQVISEAFLPVLP